MWYDITLFSDLVIYLESMQFLLRICVIVKSEIRQCDC